jgi:hypothetical protein
MRGAWLRTALLALVPLAFASAPAPASFVQAVEFPYYLSPRTAWERELVWLKNSGIRTVVFSVPWNWHQVGAEEYDFSGRTSPRRDLAGFIRLLRKLELRGWVRPLMPVANWPGGGTPENADAREQRAWIKQLERILAPQTTSHGGPIEFVEGRGLAIEAAQPPQPVTTVSAVDPAALVRSRGAIVAARGSLLWTDVEDALFPAGWSGTASPLRNGAVSLTGVERPAVDPLLREAALLRHWSGLLGQLTRTAMPKPVAGKLPEGVTAIELVSEAVSVVAISNTGKLPFADDLRVLDPRSGRTLVLPRVQVPPGEALWLPVGVSIGAVGLCRECSHFSGAEHIVYATAELLSIEYENGILAMEFAAPEAGEAILQFARQPVGPFLAAGKPAKFDWDDKTLRARLTIPAGSGRGKRVRIGIAIEEPDTSAFFNETRRLIIGQKNVVSTTYSSASLAARSRIRLPEGFTATVANKSPNELDYTIAVPADALHGDSVTLALEADGMPLGRAQVQLLRPVSVRLVEAIGMRLGEMELAFEPAAAPIDPKAGTNLDLAIRNNTSAICTYHLETAGAGLEFFPPKTDISIGPGDERLVSVRVFGDDAGPALRDWTLRISGGSTLEVPMRAVLLPRGRTVAWSADLDGDGSPEWVLESHKARAVFSAAGGGRLTEFTWKDTGANFLPAQGALAGSGKLEARASAGTLEFSGSGWKRTVRLSEGSLIVEQSTPLADLPPAARRGSANMTVERNSESKVTLTLN